MSGRDGIDISNWQGPPGDWTTAAGDIGFAGVKLTELQPGGTRYVNPDAAADWDYLKTAGKKRIAYLFAHPSVSAAQTAALFTGILRGLGLDSDDMIAIDLEVTDGLDSPEVASWARDTAAFLEHDLDRVPIIYTFLDFAGEGNCTGLGRYPLWIADPSRPPGHPRIPAPWTRWAIHQYDITAPIDRDITVYTSAAAMATALAAEKTAPEPRHAARKAAGKAKKTATTEPVLTSATAAAFLSGLLAVLQHAHTLHFTAAEVKTAVACIVALAGLCATAATKTTSTGSRAVAAVTTLLGTAAAAIAPALTGLTPTATAAQVPVAALTTGLLLRGHVSPARPPD